MHTFKTANPLKALFLFALIALGFQTKAYAQIPGYHQSGFNCYLSTNILSINLDAPRYVDQISIQDYSGDEIRPFLHSDEQSLTLQDSNLNIMLTHSTCKRGTGDTLVECIAPESPDHAWSIIQYTFRYSQPEPANPAFNESLTRSRNIEMTSMSLVIKAEPTVDPTTKKPTQAAVMHLQINGTSANGPVQLNETRRMGEWTNATNRSNWDRCVFD